MNPARKILLAIAAVSVIGPAVGLLAEHFHLSQSFASAGIGVVIGMGVALGVLSPAPKGTKSTDSSMSS